MEIHDSHMTRVLALLKRQPKRTVGELAASLSGMVQHEVRKALARLRDAGLVDRDGAPNSWYATEAKEKPAPKRANNANYWHPYTPPSMQPARSDALDATLVLSRRGDTFVKHSAPIGMESVPQKTRQTVIKKVSPINSATFCKKVPRPAISGASA